MNPPSSPGGGANQKKLQYELETVGITFDLANDAEVDATPVYAHGANQSESFHRNSPDLESFGYYHWFIVHK